MEVHKQHAPKTPVTSIYVHVKIPELELDQSTTIFWFTTSSNVVKQSVWTMQIK